MRGNADEAKFANRALNEYMIAENCHPAKTMWPIMAQSVFFMSAFFGIRGMCNAPVQSMASGGLAWFPDLTMADPTMILPTVTAATMFLQIHLGADGMNTSTMPEIMKKVNNAHKYQPQTNVSYLGVVHLASRVHPRHDQLPRGAQRLLAVQQYDLPGAGPGGQAPGGQGEAWHRGDDRVEAGGSPHEQLLREF